MVTWKTRALHRTKRRRGNLSEDRLYPKQTDLEAGSDYVPLSWTQKHKTHLAVRTSLTFTSPRKSPFLIS